MTDNPTNPSRRTVLKGIAATGAAVGTVAAVATVQAATTNKNIGPNDARLIELEAQYRPLFDRYLAVGVYSMKCHQYGEQWEPIYRQIVDTPADAQAGIDLKARVAADMLKLSWVGPVKVMQIDDTLVEDMARLAGNPLPPQTDCYELARKAELR